MCWIAAAILWVMGGWVTYIGQVATGLQRPSLGIQLLLIVLWPLVALYAMVRS